MEVLLKKNEAEINEAAAKALLLVFGVISLIAVFCWIGIFDIFFEMTAILLLVSFVTLVIPSFIILKMHVYNDLMKYLIVSSAAVMASAAYVLFTFQAVLVFLVPSVVAVLYLNKRLMYYSGIITTAAIVLSHIVSAYNLYHPHLEPFKGVGDILRFGAIPRVLQYAGCFMLLVFISKRYRKMLLQLIDERKETKAEAEDKEREEFENLLLLLSERERSVFLLMIGGNTNIQIADKLCLSNGTVKNYVSVIYDKLGTRERNVLILKYSRFYEENDQSHIGL